MLLSERKLYKWNKYIILSFVDIDSLFEGNTEEELTFAVKTNDFKFFILV